MSEEKVEPQQEMTVSQAGRLGGNRVKERYGPDYYGRIGRKGGRATSASRGPEYYSRIGSKGGNTTATRHGRSFYQAIGSKGGQRLKELVELGRREEESAGDQGEH